MTPVFKYSTYNNANNRQHSMLYYATAHKRPQLIEIKVIQYYIMATGLKAEIHKI